MNPNPRACSACAAPIPGPPFARVGDEERYDGTGYPRGLAGEDIPLGARLFAIIDALGAITSDRPYRQKAPFAQAKADIVRGSGTQFDPIAVDAFLTKEAALRELLGLKCGELAIPWETPDSGGGSRPPPHQPITRRRGNGSASRAISWAEMRTQTPLAIDLRKW